MHVLLRTLQTLLLILVFGIGTWVTAARAEVGAGVSSPAGPGPGVGFVGSSSGCQHEEQPSGEPSDGDSESAEDGKQGALPDFRLEMLGGTAFSSGSLNEELPLRGRETLGELFRPPRA